MDPNTTAGRYPEGKPANVCAPDLLVCGREVVRRERPSGQALPALEARRPRVIVRREGVGIRRAGRGAELAIPSRIMSRAKDSYDKAELVELFAGAAAPTDDDVSVTNDGRRLDSAEAVTAYFEELRAQRVLQADEEAGGAS